MIESWINLPAFWLFAVLTAFYGLSAALIAWIAFGKRTRDTIACAGGIVAPFFASVSVLFALLTGFLAGDIGDRNRAAVRAVQTEANELRSVFTLSIASASDMRDIRAAWRALVSASVKEEWPNMARGDVSPAVDRAYDELLRQVSDPKISQLASAPVHSAILNAAVRASTARADRVALAFDRSNNLKWITVLLLGALTQVAIGLVHLQNRNAQLAALLLFSIATVVALGLIALQERPFEGAIRISSYPLEELLTLQGPN